MSAFRGQIGRCIVASVLLAGCAAVYGGPYGGPGVVVVGPRQIHLPQGHYPPPGHCRLGYPDRPPGQQPPPVPCERLAVIPGSFVLYNGAAWDADYDWAAHARRHPGSVPRVIINLTVRG